MYNITSYHQRWFTIVSDYHNRMSVRENKLDWIEYNHKSKMSFNLIKPIANMIEDNPFLKRALKRCYPQPINVICPTCSSSHVHVNQYYKCATKSIPRPFAMCPINLIEPVPPKYYGRIKSIQDEIDDNTIVLYSDASLHIGSSLTAGGIVFVTKHSFWIQSFNLNHIVASSSCRAAIATVCGAIKDMEYQNILVYCDAQAAINSINNFKESKPRLERINSLDLLRQVAHELEKVQMIKTKGHDKQDEFSLNHLADALSHDHESEPCPLDLLTIVPDEFLHPKFDETVGFRVKRFAESMKDHDVFIEYILALEQLDKILIINDT